MKELVKAHRAMGFLVGTVTIDDEERSISVIQTGPDDIRDTVTTWHHMLLPATPEDVQRKAQVELEDIIKRARFLGLGITDIRAAFEAALLSEDER